MVKITKRNLEKFKRVIRAYEYELLQDIRDLEKLKKLLEEGKIMKAVDFVFDLDTPVREKIPAEIYARMPP